MNSSIYLYVLNIALIFSGAIAMVPPSYNVFAQSLQSSKNSAFPELSSSFESSPSESDSPPPALMPGVNFSEPTELSSPPADLESYFSDVNGTYINSDVGFQVDLPKDWKGKEITSFMSSVIASPHGIDLEESEEPGTVMAIQMIDEETFKKLAEIAQLIPGVAGGSSQGIDPLAFESNIGTQCNESPASFVTINSIKAEQRSAECTDEEGTTKKTKAYAFATADDSIIVLAFSSNSTNEYNQYLPLFEESVKTIKISKPGDIATSELYKKHKALETQRNQTMS